MPNRKLLEVIRCLPAEELKRLRLFITSPYFNQAYNAHQLTELFEKITAAQADENHPDLDKALLSGIYFPGKPYRENAKNPIDSLASDLFRLVRRFILQEDLAREADVPREHLALARFYQKYHLEERFWQTVESGRKALEAETKRDDRHYLNAFYLEIEVASFESTFNSYTDDANMRASHRYLDLFYVQQKIDLTCSLDFQQWRSAIEPAEELRLTRLLTDAIPGLPYLQTPVIDLYLLVLRLLKDPGNDADFEKFEQLLEQYRDATPDLNYRNLQAYYRFFVGRRYLTRGEIQIYPLLFQLYKEHLQAGYFYLDNQHKQLHPTSFKLLVNIALRAGDAAWAGSFLKEHGPDRITGTRYPLEWHSLCEAEVLFYQKKYDDAAAHLVYRQFENAEYGILADVLLIKLYLETDDDLLDSRVRALELKVRRAKLGAETRSRYLDFLSRVDKIQKYRWQKDSPKIRKIRQEVIQSPAALEREWLLRVLEGMG